MKLISLVRMLAVLTLLLSATSLFAEIEYQATAGDCSGADTSSIENCLMGDALSSPSAPVMRYCTATHKTHRAGKMDDGIIATILDALGITLDNKVGIPPG